MSKKKLGQVLWARDYISEDDLQKALDQQSTRDIPLGELLFERGLVSKHALVDALEVVTRIPYLDCSSVSAHREALRLLPRSAAERFCAFPLSFEGQKLVIVMAEPQNLYTLDELRFISGKEILPRLGFRAEILAAIEKHYGPLVDCDFALLGDPESAGDKQDPGEIEFFTTSSRQSQADAIREFQAELRQQPTPAVRLFSAMIAEAVAKRASDIHVDPHATGTTVRIRVDGILRDMIAIPRKHQDSLISRIKILADMDIAERRVPQDGRLLVRIGANRHDLRVSTLPASYGEKVVIRLLDQRTALVRFEDLGLWTEHSDLLASILKRPQGMVLVTGPTGSGKTTTLYAALNLLRSRTLNIITVENPVEYMIEGINQVQVNERAGRTFAGCLRSILRQDPNVIMVGEIRDAETAEIAVTAAQTGHLVFSTLHTNDSISAVTRLIDLNIPPFLVASSVTAIIAQRLVRRLCKCCDQVTIPPQYETQLLAAGITEFDRKTFAPVGCPACDNTGYVGRVGIYEILVFEDQVSEVVRSGGGPEEIRVFAGSNGMRFLQEDALLKVQMGLTSLEEVLRVVPFKNQNANVCQNCKRKLAPSFLFCPYCATKKPRSVLEVSLITKPVRHTTVDGAGRRL